MKYVILIIGFLVIGFFNQENFEGGGYGNISILAPILGWLIYFIIWLVVFFVFDLQLPAVTI